MLRYRHNVTGPRYSVSIAVPAPVEARGGRASQSNAYTAPILLEIERHLRRTGMSDRRFGMEAIGDPALIHDLRRGRDPSSKTAARIRAYIQRGHDHGKL